jgi:hypothetical protein
MNSANQNAQARLIILEHDITYNGDTNVLNLQIDLLASQGVNFNPQTREAIMEIAIQQYHELQSQPVHQQDTGLEDLIQMREGLFGAMPSADEIAASLQQAQNIMNQVFIDHNNNVLQDAPTELHILNTQMLQEAIQNSFETNFIERINSIQNQNLHISKSEGERILKREFDYR